MLELKFGHARWGGSGALYLQSAIAGFNSLLEAFFIESCLLASGVDDWSLCQWKAYEPRQVRKKAAVSMVFHVIQGYLIGVNCIHSSGEKCRM